MSPLHCANVTHDNFDPKCLPDSIRNYSDLGRVGQAPPNIYLQWMLAQTCGVHVADFASEFAPLPEIISHGLRSVFMIWCVYVIGNFLAVGAMSVFQIAPRGKRCCGLFRQQSYDYKRVVGPLYYLLMLLAILLSVALVVRFFWEIHSFRKLIAQKSQATGKWPVAGGGFVELPAGSRSCAHVLELRWVGYRHCFELLLLMAFTSVDLVVVLIEIAWTLMIEFCASCRCFFCSLWKGCCGICGWLCCNCCASACCAMPLVLVVLYLVFGLVAAGVCGVLLLFGLGTLLLGVTMAVRYLLIAVSGCFCKALRPTSWLDMAMLLYPFPPGSPYFATAKAVRNPLNDQERQEDFKLQEEATYGGHFDAEEGPVMSDYVVWERHLGVPQTWLAYAFPAWWSMVVAPAALLVLAVAALLSSNEILLAKSMAGSDLSWMDDAGPLSVWPYHWAVIKAIFAGLTDGFHGVFVEVPVNLFTAPMSSLQHVWGIADDGRDVSSLFGGQRFGTFRATVLSLRLILTTLFACLRLTAVIARMPDSDSSEEESYEEEED
ncbi:unnamed protein product [Effrenium voratum]|nr:unnamed protein product [Effrenium voratum]